MSDDQRVRDQTREQLLVEHRELLPHAETHLEELSRVLDDPFPNDPTTVAFMMLGIRSRTFHRGVIHALAGQGARSAEVILRALIEANVLLRFFEQGHRRGDLEARLGLWAAETERLQLAIHDEISGMNDAIRERCGGGLLSTGEQEALRAIVLQAREQAREADVPGLRDSGQLLPSIAVQVRELRDPGAAEVYTVGYRLLSATTHLAEAAFAGPYECHGDKISWSDDLAEEKKTSLGVFALTTQASTLTMVSITCKLGIEHQVDAIKRIFIPHDQPLSERLGDL